jgi:hypothetical protein
VNKEKKDSKGGEKLEFKEEKTRIKKQEMKEVKVSELGKKTVRISKL